MTPTPQNKNKNDEALLEFKQIATIGDQQYPAFELRHTLSYLRANGYDQWCDTLLDRLGLESLIQEDFLPSHLALESLQKVLETHFEVGLGVEIAKRYTVSDFQLLGSALKQAPSLYEALKIALAYYELIGSFTDLTILQDEHSFTTRIVNVSGLSNDLVHFIFELTISGMTSIGESISGTRIRPKVLRFTQALSHEQIEMLQKTFQCPIEDKATFNEWVLNLSDLQEPIEHPKPARDELEHAIQNLNALMDELKAQFALVDQFNTLVRKNEESFPNSKELANQLFMSERTFRRKLNLVGVNYNMLMSKIRCQIAIAMLQTGEYTNEDMAFDLGFSDAANFCNAFKKWTGHTPNHYRP